MAPRKRFAVCLIGGEPPRVESPGGSASLKVRSKDYVPIWSEGRRGAAVVSDNRKRVNRCAFQSAFVPRIDAARLDINPAGMRRGFSL